MDIIKDCDAGLAVSSEKETCVDSQIVAIDYIIIGKFGTAPGAVNGEFPTPTEMQTYLTAGNGYIMPVTNGVKPIPTPVTVSGIDTYKGREKTVLQTETLTVRFRNVDNNFRVMQRANNLNNQIGQLWYVGLLDTGQYALVGGVNGYECNVFLPEFAQDGRGTNSQYVEKTFTWETKQSEVDLFSSAGAYDALTNVVTVGTYAYANPTGTSEDTFDVDSFAKVTGWNKNTVPVLYAEVDVGGTKVEFFESDAERTAGTPVALEIDIAVSNQISSTGDYGGELTIIKDGLIAADKFDVVYSAY